MLTVLHVLVDLVVSAAVFAECLWVARKSRTLGAIVALGVELRVASGVALFAISYFDLGILRGLHSGGGFWALAIDAHTYYTFAADAAATSLWHLTWAVPSPSYVTFLALWLRGTGASVLAAILFNIVCYGVTVAALVAGVDHDDRQSRFAAPVIVLSAFSFSPILLLTSTQTLKDPFFAMLSAIACRAAFEIFHKIRRVPARRTLAFASTVGVAILAVGLVGGLRAYYAAFLWLGFAAGFVAIVAVPGRESPGRARLTLAGTAILALMWLAFMAGGGPYYRMYKDEFTRLGLATAVQLSRTGFERAGGATNLSAPPAAPTNVTVPPAYQTSLFFDDAGGRLQNAPVSDGALSDTLNQLLDGTARKVYVVSHSGEPATTAANPTGEPALDAALRQDGLEVTALPLSIDDRVPRDASIVVLVGDRVPSARDELLAFLGRGGKILRVVPQDSQDAAWSRLQAEPMTHPVEEMVASGGPRHLATGLAAMFVPLSILKALSVVAFPGGRGLLLVADLDTVFLDLSLLAIGTLIVRKRAVMATPVSSLLFTLAVAGISTILLAYVVTNFGTLFRLRLLAAVPAWMAPLALRNRPTADRP
jgi:hypothetical protein